jgi:hypothetical protein
MSKYQVDGRTGNLIGGNLVGGATTITHQGQPTTTTTTYTTTEYVQPVHTGATTYTTSALPAVATYTQAVPVTYATAVQPTVTYNTGVVSSQVGFGAISTGEVIKGKNKSIFRREQN